MEKVTSVDIHDYIEPNRFYQDDADKIKLNWFCYEFSNNFYQAIKDSKDLSGYRKKHSEDNISEFCLYFSKRLRKSIFDAATAKKKGVEFNGLYVYEFYPGISKKLIELLLEAALSAWQDQITLCAVCPNRCLENGFDLCIELFENI